MKKLRITSWIIGISLALVLGASLRALTWRETSNIHFSLDYCNGYYWGSAVMRDAHLIGPGADLSGGSLEHWQRFFSAYAALYDRVSRQGASRNNDYWLDYPPLRLLVMALWTKHVREHNPTLEKPSPHDVQPLLLLNMMVELVSAVSMFYLVRFWAQRIAFSPSRPGWRMWPNGLAFGAALLVWLNPATIVNSFAWPQWDIWLLPFFILAALSGSTSRWFVCGILIGLAGFLKAQILIVAAFFPLWALFSEGFPAGFRTLAGWLVAAVAMACPWILKGLHPYSGTAALLFAAAPLAWYLARRKGNELPWAMAASALAAGIVGFFTHGSFTWLEVGFHYGSERYLHMFEGEVYNFPSLLAGLGWQITDPLLQTKFITHSPIVLLTVRTALWLSFAAALVVSALAMAYHAKRRNPEILLSVALPWIAMFALLGQMHERYLLWGAMMCAGAALLNPMLFLLYSTLSLGTCCMILTVMLRHVAEQMAPDSAELFGNFNFGLSAVFSLIFVAAFLWTLRLPLVEAWRNLKNAFDSGMGNATEI